MVMKECLCSGFVYQKGQCFCIPVWEHKTYKWIKKQHLFTKEERSHEFKECYEKMGADYEDVLSG